MDDEDLPSGSNAGRSVLEERVRRCYRSWSTWYFGAYYGADAPYPAVHVDIIRQELQRSRARVILDAGCGPASMLRLLDDEGLELYGFDLTPEMIDEARRVLAPRGVVPSRLWLGSVTDPAAFCPPPGRATGYDAAMCIGVMPHVPPEADRAVLTNLRDAVVPGGRVLVEMRNQMFALFTLNRFTSELFTASLIDAPRMRREAENEAEAAALERALAELNTHFRLELPPIRPSPDANDPSYDEVLSRSHNPFEMRALAEAVGLKDVELLFYHYHAVPPMLEREIPSLARRASLAMEDPRDWRGYVQASAFILSGTRP